MHLLPRQPLLRILLIPALLTIAVPLQILAQGTTYTWGGLDGSWNSAEDWEPDGVPGSGDTAIVTTGRIAAAGGAVVADLFFGGGTITGDGVAVTNQFIWTGGVFEGTGTILVAEGASMTVEGGGIKSMVDRWRLVNEGTGVINRSFWCSGTATFENRGHLVLAFQDDRFADCTLENKAGGMLRKVGPSTTRVDRLVSEGMLAVEDGTLLVWLSSVISGLVSLEGDLPLLTRGTLLFGPGATHDILETAEVVGSGTLSIDTGSLRIDAPMDIGELAMGHGGEIHLRKNAVVRQLAMSNGLLRGGAEIAVADSFLWSGGTLGDSVTVRVRETAHMRARGESNSVYSAAAHGGSRLLLEGTAEMPVLPIFCHNTVTLQNFGDLEVSYSDVSLGDCTLHNMPAGTLRKTGPSTSRVHHLLNQGNLVISEGTLATWFDSENSGSISIAENGAYSIGGGTPQSSTVDGSITGQGLLAVNGPLVTEGLLDVHDIDITGSLDLRAAGHADRVTLNGGIVQGSQLLSIRDRFDWIMGGMQQTGGVLIEESADAHLQGAGLMHLNQQARFVNEGMTFVETAYYCDGTAAIVNRGVMELLYTGSAGSCPLWNELSGVLRKKGSGSARLDDIRNEGLLEIEQGTLVGFSRSELNGEQVILGKARLDVGPGPILLDSTSTVSGDGLVAFVTPPATNDATFSPGMSTGILTVGSDLRCDRQFVYSLELGGYGGGVGFDSLVVLGQANLDGRLAGKLTGGFAPQLGDVFEVMRFDTRNGEFREIGISSPGPHRVWDVSYSDSSVVLTVVEGNSAPVAVNDTLSTHEDVAGTFDVLVNDFDTDLDDLEILSVTPPLHGTTDVIDGEIVYDPDADYHGTDDFTYEIGDGLGGTAVGHVHVTVLSVNDEPTVSEIVDPDDSLVIAIEGESDATLSVSWSVSTDADGDPVSYTWELSATSTSFGEPLLTVEAGRETVTDVPFGELAGILTGLGVEVGVTRTMYHRVVATDGDAVAEGPPSGLQLTRGLMVGSGSSELPESFALHANYPNPFNPSTVIPYDLPANGEVAIRVFDVLGREVMRLDEGVKPGGRHRAELEVFALPSGVYVLELQVVRAGVLQFRSSRPVVLLR